MGRYTKQDVIDLVRENDVEFIRLQFSDLFGTMKNVAITARQLEKALDNKCTFDGSSVDGFVRIEESDMYLYPDLKIYFKFKFILKNEFYRIKPKHFVLRKRKNKINAK